jgi:hypothetical protein
LILFDQIKEATMKTSLKTSWALALLSAIILALGAVPADAAGSPNRTWVSGSGADSGTCPITAPCASFAYALSQTNPGGEIDCLNAGDFSGSIVTGSYLTITQSVSIVCDGVSNGGILATGSGIAVSIGGPSAIVVYLSGLNLNGDAGGGSIGLNVQGQSTVYIVHCTIQGFNGSGILLDSFSEDPVRVVIKDSIIVNNGTGVDVNPSGAADAAIIFNSVVDGNTSSAAEGSGAGGASVIALTQTLLTGSPTGLGLQNGASADLIGPSNVIAGAITGTTTSVPFK